jgi:hypothetical protein
MLDATRLDMAHRSPELATHEAKLVTSRACTLRRADFHGFPFHKGPNRRIPPWNASAGINSTMGLTNGQTRSDRMTAVFHA